MKKLFIVGKHCDNGKNNEWQYHGVFDNEKMALKECIDYRYFIGPTSLNEPMPHESIDWPDAYYPIARKQEDNASTAS